MRSRRWFTGRILCCGVLLWSAAAGRNLAADANANYLAAEQLAAKETQQAPCCECDCGCGLGLFDCCLGEPFTLFPETPWGKISGYAQAGYHSANDGTFNHHPGQVYLHQAYLYAEKLAKTDDSCWNWGYRADALYGIDASLAQSFGNDWGEFDFSPAFNQGIWGWALPQLYGEVAYDKLSVKIGHFYTPQGYEVVMATGNFFYSHAFSHMWNEPFTHTGVLGTYKANDQLDVYGGWTLGWDTGFDRFSNNGTGPNQGSNYIGGFAYQLYDNLKVTYVTTAGDLGWRGEGYSHSVICDFKVNERLTYILQNDITSTNLAGWNDVALINYLIYRLNDCWAVGARAEWIDFDSVANGRKPAYELTAGVNWRPHANFLLRPEIRYQWGDGLTNIGLPTEQTIFGIDGILTF